MCAPLPSKKEKTQHFEAGNCDIQPYSSSRVVTFFLEWATDKPKLSIMATTLVLQHPTDQQKTQQQHARGSGQWSLTHLRPYPPCGERLAVVGLHMDAASPNNRPGCTRRLETVPSFASHGMLSVVQRRRCCRFTTYSTKLSHSHCLCMYHPATTQTPIDDSSANTSLNLSRPFGNSPRPANLSSAS